ncbi:MAG: hypothetical protein IPH07_02805 [Deltaproteobacteria bacterium]|nr:hypothetical protein [Deltaproteobacteria bacterium]MBK8238058.1 hypothetical protein [Deltaproteobacteria bacterium]MBK8718598.1 hypothetical protein [Deltaproteobacteria bacterium]MBP7290484.1 hypothetical protein [Nannocystaceae bacterium]
MHHHCDHDHGHADDDGEPSSTGFLPISLALALFITGLFVLDVIPWHC